MKNHPSSPCACGSGLPVEACCGPLLEGAPAETAEAVMRSRYTAYALSDSAYLLKTWHSSTRPERLALSGPKWLGLEIRAVRGGGADDESGSVEFVARYLADGRVGALHESSRFLREGGQWRYVDGDAFPATESKVSRNDPCPCGSGRKFKRCCG